MMADDIQRQDRGDVTILSVPAHLDTLASETLEQICIELAKENRFRAVVDCEHLQFLNSIVIRNLLNFHRETLKHGGDLKFANVSIRVEDIFHLTKLDDVFSVYVTVDEAVAAF